MHQRSLILFQSSASEVLIVRVLHGSRDLLALFSGDAIDSFLERHQPEGRLARLRQARGLWAQRCDLPAWDELRRELDRQQS